MLVAAGFLAGCGGAHAVPPSIALPASDQNAASRASASGFAVLYSFRGGYDGGDPATGLVLDANGKLYGTTVIGGTYNCGTVFELTPQASPPWPETVLYDFDCAAHGKNPYGGVTFDGHGNLDGTTVAGGSGCSDGCGIAYQLTPSGETVLHDFAGGSDGFGPGGGLTIARGALFGTTPDGGSGGEGVVYEIARSHGGWYERVIHAFTGGSDGGVGSLGQLLLTQSRKIFGVTEIGGAYGGGTVFVLRWASKGEWKLTTLHAFGGSPDGASPYGGLVGNGLGNLYGTTYYGGTHDLGTVFELSARNGGSYSERVLYSFRGGRDGSSPTSTLLQENDLLYGTTSTGGGKCGCGTIFAVDPLTGKETVLHRFTGSDGANPYYGLARDANGTLYGTSVAGGTSGQGTVFEFMPSKPHESQALERMKEPL